MKYINMNEWNRKNHYDYFKQLDYPHFNICANLDITTFYRCIKERNQPFFLSMLYIATKAANQVKELRYRIREDQVIEHELVSPSFTVMTEDEVFSFCVTQFVDQFHVFSTNAAKAMEDVKNHVSVEDEPGKDDLLYVSSLPWVSFTSITHPIQMNPVDSIPRITWGKFFAENEKIILPFSVQAHHALVDGLHIGRYYGIIQEMLDHFHEYNQE